MIWDLLSLPGMLIDAAGIHIVGTLVPVRTDPMICRVQSKMNMKDPCSKILRF
jgi:hypothetical protein